MSPKFPDVYLRHGHPPPVTMKSPVICTTGDAAFQWLKAHTASATQIWIAVAFLDKRAIERLLEFLDSALAREDSRCVLLWGEPFDGRESLEMLRFLGETKTKYGARFETRRMPSGHASVFHPKVYILQEARSSVSVLIGSANLTDAGMGRNVEACLGYDFPYDSLDPWVTDLVRDFIRWWGESGSLKKVDFSIVEDDEPNRPGRIIQIDTVVPEFRQRITDALSDCLIVGIDVYTKQTRLQLPRDLLEIQREEISGTVLTYRDDNSLSLLVVPAAVDNEMKALRSFAWERIRRFTLGTPWGRLVTPSGRSVLIAELPEIMRRIARSLKKVKEISSTAPADYEEMLRSDFRQIWEKLHPGEAPPDETVARVLELASEARKRFLSLDPPPIHSRIRLTRPIDEWVADQDPFLRQQMDSCHREDLRLFLIKAASAPRRSLLKYRAPELAKCLCPLPDPGMEEALMHRWRGDEPSAESQQRNLADGRTLSEMKAKLKAQVEEIHGWYPLSFDEVISKYEELLNMRLLS